MGSETVFRYESSVLHVDECCQSQFLCGMESSRLFTIDLELEQDLVEALMKQHLEIIWL